MLPITFKHWKDCCTAVFSLKNKKLHVQWYPFSVLTRSERKWVSSEGFFLEYIKSGLFTYFSDTWLISDNFITKSNGEFRKSSLVSPLLNLIYLAIVKDIAERYKGTRDDLISVYYSGNFMANRLDYKKDYHLFFKQINAEKEHYDYFIKTDLRDFFANIDINCLMGLIDAGTVAGGKPLRQRDLSLYRQLLLTLGRRGFPLIQNSTASSFLATVAYMDSFDSSVFRYLRNRPLEISTFRMVRYVDDLYILFSSDLNKNDLIPFYNNLIEHMTSELRGLSLALNRSKTRFEETDRIEEELARSRYDDRFLGKPFDVSKQVSVESITDFLEALDRAQTENALRNEEYDALVRQHFTISGLEYSSQEVYNTVVYGGNALLRSRRVISCLQAVLSKGHGIVKFDPNRLMIMVLGTRDEGLIKLILNSLFQTFRANQWNAYDTAVALSYLVQRRFQHKDLLGILSDREPGLYAFYDRFCRQSFVSSLSNVAGNPILHFYRTRCWQGDDVMFYLHCFYSMELLSGNMLPAFAYYKSFFDRMSAHLGEWAKSRPNFNGYYKESVLVNLYSDISGAEHTVREAHKLRNANPLAHSSAGLVSETDDTSDRLRSCILGLSGIIDRKMTQNINRNDQSDI